MFKNFSVVIYSSTATPLMPSNFTLITHLEAANNWTIELTWIPPEDSHVSYYHLLIHPPINNEYCMNGDCTCNCTSIVFEGLNVSNIYSFFVLAMNCIGNSTAITTSIVWPSSTMTGLLNTSTETYSNKIMG